MEEDIKVITMTNRSQARSRLIVVCMSSVLFVPGCIPDERAREEQRERERISRLTEIRSKFSAPCLLGALGFVCLTFLGPTVLEGARRTIAEKYNLSKSAQHEIALLLYLGIVAGILLMAFFNSHLSAVKPAIFLLIGATAYPFFIHVLPSIQTEDASRRKTAVAQIKSFVMLIFIFYVVLRFLSPDGFGAIQLK
jgi:hypothetical protein